ncbi:MAG TPA: cytochrome C, partial [Bacteroidales bacterium]|nr:cytochrome C [Bacteroidales bacterium]
EPYHEEDSMGNHSYLSEKGTFVWAKNVKPEYVWFNGTADHYMFGDKVDTTKPIAMNTLRGSYSDPAAQIIPVKVHRAKQLFDPQYGNIIQPKLFAKEKGQGALWKDFDFNAASATGMKYIGQPYSGTYTFVHTESFWPLNHQVAPKEQSLSCVECHSRNGRLANITDFYLPGRDRHAGVELFGIISIIVSLVGIAIHATLRIISHRKELK